MYQPNRVIGIVPAASLLRFALAALAAVLLAACAAPPASPAPGALPSPAASGAPALQASATPGGAPQAAPLLLAPTATKTREALATPTPTRKAAQKTPTRTPVVSQALGCTLQAGQVISATLETHRLRLPLVYRVYLPPCYEESPTRRYPSLYLFHGQSYSDDQWDRMGVDETADRLIAAGEIAPLIIIMPYERYGGQPTETGFSDAVVKELIPAIDATYRTRVQRRYRAVGGLSRGAGWAVHFGIAHWPLFGRIGAHSAAVFHTDAQRMRTRLGEIPPEQYPLVYLDIGDRDRPEILRSTEWFEELLNAYDIPHEWHLFSGYHAESYWSEHMEAYLRWYTREW